MTLHDFIFTALGRCFAFYCLALTAAQVYFVISTFYANRRFLPGLVFCFSFFPDFFFTSLLLSYIFRPNISPPWVLSFFRAPAWSFLLAALLLTAAAIYNLYWLLSWKKTHMTAEIIKETIDLLPSGICIGDESGMIVMANLRMNDLYHQITGQQLLTVPLLWQSLTAVSGGRESQDGVILPHPDGMVILFSRSPVSIQGMHYTQITAVDITAQSHLTNELMASNAQLTSIQKRISNYGNQVDAVVRMQEILNAKMAVHDEVGHALLMTKYFVEHPENVDQDNLLTLLKNTNEYLLREAEDAAPDNGLATALSMARDIGVHVVIQGRVPKEPKIRLLLSRAITECAANTLKHAGGDRLNLLLKRDQDALIVSITNNGEKPQGKIQESGGLKSLRHLVFQAGGTMVVESAPEFHLQLTLPVNLLEKDAENS